MTDELLEIADDLCRVKRLAWALQAAIEGIESRDTSVQGAAHLCGIHVAGLEELEQRIDRLRRQDRHSLGEGPISG